MPTAFVLLNIDKQKGTASTALGPSMGMEPTSLSRILKTMEDKGAICREKNPDDGRSVIIKLTDYGKEMRKISKGHVILFNETVRKNVSEKDLELFDAKINDKEYIFSLIVESIDYFKDKVNNHKLVILYMAAAQYAYVNKFNNKFDYYIQNINQMYSNDIKTRNLIDYMKHDVKKHNYDIYNIYSYSFDGF